MIATLGQKIANPKKGYDNFFYVTNFKKAVRYACWTSNYSSRTVGDVLITDKNGKYEQFYYHWHKDWIAKSNYSVPLSEDVEMFAIHTPHARYTPMQEYWKFFGVNNNTETVYKMYENEYEYLPLKLPDLHVKNT